MIPFLVIGDHPSLPTGLGRITRDLVAQLRLDVAAGALPPLDLVQVGWREEPGWEWAQWPVYQLSTLPEDWGAETVAKLWAERWGDQPGIVFSVWDPMRVFALSRTRGPWDLWGYFPIDAHAAGGRLSGPSGSAVAQYNRVLGYGRWGATVLRSVRSEPVAFLPHGISPEVWNTAVDIEGRLGYRYKPDRLLIGTVASNQARKDWGVVAQTLAELKARGHAVYGWWHTDRLVGPAWSLVQLVEDCGLARQVTITTEQDRLRDADLAGLYQACTVTLAPGLGEGFGYPIVESLASGTPVIHSTYGGGAELVPRPEWTIPVRAWRLESPHALQRPVYLAEDFANAIERAVEWRAGVGPAVCREYCQGAVAHLAWPALWGRWRSWFRQGLDAV